MAFAASSPSLAEGFYISASGGVNWTDSTKVTFFDGEEFHDVKWNPNTGLTFGGAVGYEGFFSDAMGYRVEVEGFYNDNNVGSSSLTLDGEGLEDLDGDVKAYGAMGNFYLTFGGDGARLTPYIGAGAGIANLDPNITHTLFRVGGSDSAFAWQGFAGLEMPIGSNWRASTEVRYLSTNNGSFDANIGFDDIPFKTDYASTSVLVKFRYLFNGN